MDVRTISWAGYQLRQSSAEVFDIGSPDMEPSDITPVFSSDAEYRCQKVSPDTEVDDG